MVRMLAVVAGVGFAVTACAATTEAPKPPVWSATYGVGFDAMTNCLATRPTTAFSASVPVYGPEGVATIAFVPTGAAQARSEYVVRRLPGGAAHVDWRRSGMSADWTG